VQFVTPTSRPPKESSSAPPALNKVLGKKEQISPARQVTQSSDINSESTPSSRFAKREFSASFKTYRPSYKLPDHVKTRAESFRLHRPKDFIKPASAEEPARPSGNRIIFNSVTPVSNREPTPFTSTPLNKEQISTPSNLTNTPKTTSSLQRSESCKENQSTSLQESLPHIPLVRGNKRRSRGILSRILSSKIDSEKANQPRIVPPPASTKSPEKVLSPPTAKPLQSVFEENVGRQTKSPVSDVTEQDSAAVLPNQEESVKPVCIEKSIEKSPLKEPDVAEGLQPSKDQVKEVETSQLAVACEQSSSEKSSVEVKTLLASLINQTVSLIENSGPVQNTNASQAPVDQPKLNKSSFELKSPKTDSQLLSPEPLVHSEEVDSSVIKEVELVVKEVFSPVVVKPESPVLLLENLPETSLEDNLCFPCQSDSSLSFESSDSDECYEDEMEGRYSLRSRRHEGTGSVKSRIQATENRNGTTELKRNRQGVDSRAFRNAEGVKSRMNKFASKVTSSTIAGKSSAKKKVITNPDANNNINGQVPLPKSKSTTESKSSSLDTTKQEQKLIVANVIANGDATEPTVNGKVEENKIVPQSPEKKPDYNIPNHRIAADTPIAEKAAAIKCNGELNTISSPVPSVNKANVLNPPQGGSKEDVIDGVATSIEKILSTDENKQPVIPNEVSYF